MSKISIPDEVMVYFRRTGAEGGKARAKKYTKEQLSEMGRKGGRPAGAGKTVSIRRKRGTR